MVRSLSQKKFRQLHGLFVVEGAKMLAELRNSDFEVEHWLLETSFAETFTVSDNLITINQTELKKISGNVHPEAGLAIVRIPHEKTVFVPKTDDFYIALDGIRDPGNLGTIFRTLDWFGATDLICSDDTVDCFNPKVVQASMGAIFRVKAHYCLLPDFLNRQKDSFRCLGADLNGQNVFQTSLTGTIMVIGNEANGIRTNVAKHLHHTVTIPKITMKAESLNAATATSIIFAEYAKTCLYGK